MIFRTPKWRLLLLIWIVFFIKITNGQSVIKRLNTIDSTSQSGQNLNLSCNNWLSTPVFQSYVSLGDLDIPGNQLTVEAVINRTQPYSPGTGNNNDGDVVSKHNDPSDVNYLLRPNHAYITTTNGFFATPDACEIELNKTYHLAMVYDGSTLKYYRNGFLLAQVSASGNLIQNNHETRIGRYAGSVIENFIGFINEVRIWNVARTQSQIQTYMNSSLPNPTTQTGLQAYYIFNDLTNKQGNTTWNGFLGGSAAINTTNTSCSFTPDSCSVTFATNIGNIINDYTPVLSFDPCKNLITVEDASAFHIGDTVLIIQMKGAVIDSTNTATFGTITDYKNCGNYEYNYVKAITANIIELKNNVTRQYDIPNGKVQLIRVPYYLTANVTSTLTCLPWNGTIGGVLAINVRDTLNLSAPVSVNGKGFRGGINGNNLTNTMSCSQTGFAYSSVDPLGAPKGEGIAIVSTNISNGRGALANGGGGGQDHNSGGAGGGNANTGGNGGYQFEPCINGPFDNGGKQGTYLLYSNTQNKIFMGGGGGSGHANNISGFQPDGANGGGIIIINSPVIRNNGFSILSDGADAITCVDNATNNRCNEAMGGGGAGGTILLNTNNFINPIDVSAKGGKGADMSYLSISSPNTPFRHGPGGGGSGGLLWLKTNSLPSTLTPILTGGLNGINTFYGADPWGATPGGNGLNLFQLDVPVDTTLFTPNIDSVRIKDSLLINCGGFQFTGLGYTHTTGIASWHWNFGDLATANTQIATHSYTTNGTYNVQLIVTDNNGCKDSIIKSITVNCQQNNISNIINAYTPVISLNPCNNSITVEDGTAYNAGDTVLIIQMKGADIDISESATFGTVTDYHSAGNYEFNIVKAKSGNIIELKYFLTRTYDLPGGKVQLIRVPYYNSATISATLTCLPWDGSKGGVLVLNARDTVTMNADINVDGKGFLGGTGFNSGNPVLLCFKNNYNYPSTSQADAGLKGESISILPNSIVRGKGAPASGGGAGLGHNSGGGGGSNAGGGGFGGYQLDNCGSFPFDNRGIGGRPLSYSSATNKIFLGGGGGAGNADNPGNPPPTGGNGGGIVIIKTNFLQSNNNNILANGTPGTSCATPPSPDCHDGMPGGGGGGTVLLHVNNYIDNAATTQNGGKGIDMVGASAIGGRIGPGGGGGGGLTFLKNASLPASVSSTHNGGINGVITQDGNNPYGATSGTAGINLFNLVLPIDTVLFRPNIDSVRIKDSAISCSGFQFTALGYTNTSPVTTWNWNYGDNTTGTGLVTTHTYSGNGPYNVQLIGTDVNGCKDSIISTITITPLSVNAGADTSICSNSTVSVNLHSTFNGSNSGFQWSPAGVLNNASLQNPTATISATTMFYLTATAASGCTAIDSVQVTINPVPAVSTINDVSICKRDSILLSTVTTGTSIQWAPAASVNNATIASPYFTDTLSQQMIVTATNSLTGCFKKDTVNITIKPTPTVIANPDTALCGPHAVN
ncbi:MAG: PKD domain-containing protein, partial [Bacteroidetes bacterium]|nr:PKD domain-containing protein [Bacteroidota bacterium]